MSQIQRGARNRRTPYFMVDLVGQEVLELKYYGWTRAVELWDHIMAVGEPQGLVPTGPSDIRRTEGVEFDGDPFPNLNGVKGPVF